MYARIGDIIEVEGIRYKLQRENTQLVLKIPPRNCIACDVNDVADPDANGGDYIDGHLCQGCMVKAMQFTVIKDALNHLGDCDDELRQAIETWDEIDAKWRGKGVQYMTRGDSSWDYMRGDATSAREAMTNWTHAINAVIESGTIV